MKDTSEEGEVLPHLSSSIDPRRTRALVVRRALSTQAKEGDNKEKREDIFYTCCLINGTPCSVIINIKSCIIFVSKSLVKELGLE